MTRETAIRYGRTSARPHGTAGDPRRCVEEVPGRFAGRQCSRRRGHGPGGRYCPQHAAALDRAAADSSRTAEEISAARLRRTS